MDLNGCEKSNIGGDVFYCPITIQYVGIHLRAEEWLLRKEQLVFGAEIIWNEVSCQTNSIAGIIKSWIDDAITSVFEVPYFRFDWSP